MSKLVLAVIVFLAGMGISRFLDRAEELPLQARRLASRLTFVGGIAIPILILIFSTFRIIPAGHVGVALLFGQVQPVPLQEGLNLVNPLYDVINMDTRVARHTARYDAASKDLQAVHVEMVLNFRLLPEKAAEVYQRVGIGYSNVIVDPAAQEVLKANTALHNAAEILQKRPAIKADIQKDLTTWLVKYGIELKEVALSNIRFDPSYERAVRWPLATRSR